MFVNKIFDVSDTNFLKKNSFRFSYVIEHDQALLPSLNLYTFRKKSSGILLYEDSTYCRQERAIR